MIRHFFGIIFLMSASSLFSMQTIRIKSELLSKPISEKPVFNKYFYDLAKTQNCDDTVFNFFIKEDLFKQLFIEALNRTELDEKPFNKLLKRVQTGKVTLIECNNGDVLYKMTSRDARHRLLSYIKTTENFKLSKFNGNTAYLALKRVKMDRNNSDQLYLAGFNSDYLLTDQESANEEFEELTSPPK